MRILIAPDKFKESLTAKQVASAIRDGFQSVFPEANFDIVPIADGGEGTAQIFLEALGGHSIEIAAHDALGRAVTAAYSWIPKSGLAVSNELRLGTLADRRIRTRSKAGVHVRDGSVDGRCRGARSQESDCRIRWKRDERCRGWHGCSAGVEFLDDRNQPVASYPADYLRIRQIVPPDAPFSCSVTGLCDVRNPLLGESGATRIFGPQKGATPGMLASLEKALSHIAHLCREQLGSDFSNSPGAGAAGGLGFGLLSFCRGSLEPGFQAVARLMDLESKAAGADLVITGEGRLDAQSLHGKAPFEIARLAERHGKPVIGFAGFVEEDLPGLDACVPIANGPLTLNESRLRAAELLRRAAARTARLLKITL